MKKSILIIIYIILIIATLKLIYNIAGNTILIKKYDNGEYSKTQAKCLTCLNFPQSYVADYNYGNILYQNGEYEDAMEQYKKALNVNVPKDKECSIRINYALAVCKTVEVNEENQESINNAIKTYESAIDILTKEGCANKDNNNGHSQKAEQLKKDIKKEINRLKKLQKDKNEEDEDKEDEEKEEKEERDDKNTETIEAKIQDIKEQATKEQREIEIEFKQYNKDKDKDITAKNW